MKINDVLKEFAPSGGGGSGNYFQELASAWYNGTFDTGSLQKGIKSQEDVERLLNRGIVCPDGKTRKLHIDYNSDFDGVEIYSDDYYEYGDHDDTIDSRTGQKWGPYDFMAFSDEDLSEGINEFAPPGDSDGDDGFDDETLKRLAAEWYNGDEDPRVEQTLAAAGWEIGQDEGYEDEPGVFVVQAGDVNGNSYMSWPANELRSGVAEGYDDEEHPIRDDGNEGIPGKQRYPGKLKTKGVAEGKPEKPEQPEADYGDDYQAMVSRVKKLAGLGPLKTVWDPQKRVYKNVPTAVQPKKEQ